MKTFFGRKFNYFYLSWEIQKDTSEDSWLGWEAEFQGLGVDTSKESKGPIILVIPAFAKFGQKSFSAYPAGLRTGLYHHSLSFRSTLMIHSTFPQPSAQEIPPPWPCTKPCSLKEAEARITNLTPTYAQEASSLSQ